jgi:hypothetical protein
MAQGQPLRVWMVERGNTLAPASTHENGMVRTGIRTKLHKWFTQVAKHTNAATGRPKGYRAEVDVQWAPSLSTSQVSDYDIVIYFSPSPFSGTPGKPALPTLHDGAYKTAASQIKDPQLQKPLLAALGNTAGAAGHTVRGSQGNMMVPILSELFMLYDNQSSNLQARVDKNVERFASAAFHEAGHNKATSDLHKNGGGGIFADVYQGQALNASNIAFMASNIWNWGPQYIVGQSLSPVSPPP